jgi:hypothetical protein
MFAIGIDRLPVLIASGTSLSAAVPLGSKVLIGIGMPAVGWDAAALTFQGSLDGGITWLELMNDASAAISAAVAAGQFIMLSTLFSWRAINHIKVRSGTSGAPVNQTADRTLTLVLRSDIT